MAAKVRVSPMDTERTARVEHHPPGLQTFTQETDTTTHKPLQPGVTPDFGICQVTEKIHNRTDDRLELCNVLCLRKRLRLETSDLGAETIKFAINATRVVTTV